MSGERFTNIIGDWDTYKKYYTKTNRYLPFLKKSLNITCTKGVCGQGGFGKVFISEANDGTKAIVKLIVLERMSLLIDAINEAQILKLITPLDIAPEFYSFCVDNKKKYAVLIMKYINATTLAFIFKKLEDEYFAIRREYYSGDISAKDQLNKLVDINNSLIDKLESIINILHRQGIVHYDLKPQNVLAETLADGSYKLYLIDFGSSQIIGENYRSVPETPGYSLKFGMTHLGHINNLPTESLNQHVKARIYPNLYAKHYHNNIFNNDLRWKVSPLANNFSLKIIKDKFKLKKYGGKRKTRRRK